MSATPPEAPVQQKIRIALPYLTPIATYGLLGVTVLIYLLQALSVALFDYAVYEYDWLLALGGHFNPAIRAGELWRMITPVFLHFYPAHLLLNMYALFSLGAFLESQFGRGRFLLLYFLGGFSGNVFSLLLLDDQTLTAGASTAVFGLIAAEAVFFYQNRELFGARAQKALTNSAVILTLNFLAGTLAGANFWGHLGGLLGGALFAWFAGPCWGVQGVPPALTLQDRRRPREVFIGTGLALLLFGALFVWGMMHPLK